MTNAVTGLAAAGATRSFQPQSSPALAPDAAGKAAGRRALDALEAVEHPSDPQMAAEIISRHLDPYTRDTTLPLHVVGFLDRRWRSVLTRACVEEGDQGSRWRWALDTTEMLCWSVQPKRDQAAKQRLFALLPELLQRLHAGLETLSMHRVEEDAFFSELSKLHVAAFLLRKMFSSGERLHFGARYQALNWRFEYWHDKVRDSRVIPSLVSGSGLVFGARHKGKGIFALQPPTPTDPARIVWEFDTAAPDCSTPCFYQGRLYVLDGIRHGKVVTCLDPKTGRQFWQGTIGGRGPWRASLTAADGKLYCINETGEIVVLRAGDERFEILFETKIDEPRIQSSIAIANGRLYIRTAENLYCIMKD